MKDELITYYNGNIYIGKGHIGGNERPLAKYMPKEQTPLKNNKKGLRKGK